MSRQFDEEDRTEAADRLTCERFSELHSGFLTGDAGTVKFVCDSFADLLTDNELLGNLIKLAITDEQAAGAELARLVSVTLHAEAEEFADAQVLQAEQARKAQEAADKHEQAVWLRMA